MTKYDDTYGQIILDKPNERVEFTKQSSVYHPSYALWVSGSATGIEVTFGGKIFSGICGVYSAADDAEITITGTGYIGGETALLLDGANLSLENRGAITATSYGIVSDSLDASIVNDGLITAPIAVSLRATEGTQLVNERGGEIIGVNAGVFFTDVATPTSVNVINHGLIAAAADAIVGCASVDHVTNRGEIVGNINLRDGNDLFDGRRGTITGDILGGYGDDTFVLDDSRTQIVEEPNRGIDSVHASTDYRLSANVEALYLLGRKDLTAHGNDEDNVIQGNKGDNVIFGHDGTNILDGGRGNDVLIGGGQRDVFVFNPGDGRDTIRNFQDGVDVFNIAAFSRFDELQEILDHARERNGDVVISFGRDQLTIENCTKAQLDASDFPG
jgi:Ca2+-binding RTX toxin-like protein